MKKLSYLLIGIFLALPLFTYGQSSSLWKFIGNLRPVVSTWRVDSPGGLSGSTTLTASHLKSCNTIDTNGNGVFTCGTDEGGSASTVNTGAILSAGDSRWVNTSGDTMTGALSITGAGLNVSGLATTNRNISLQSGGLSRWTVRVDNAQNYKLVRHDGAGSALDSPFEINPTTGFVQIGDVAKAPSVQLEVNGAMSGSTLTTTALKNCTNVSTSAGGVYACNNNVYLATSTGALKTFFDLHYLQTSTGSLKSLFDTLYFRSSTGSLKTFFDQQYLRTSTGSLKVFFDANYFRTSTGALKANFQQQFLASSTGAVKANFQQQFLANSTGGLRTAFGFQFIQSSTGALKKNFQSQFVASSTGALKSLFDTLYFRSSTGSLKTYFDQQYLRTSTGSLKVLFDANYFRTSTGSLKAYFRTLDEARYVNTSGDTMTGTLTIRGTMTGWHLFAGTMSGAGLTDCDADNQTLAWDATTRTFGCGDDDTSASGFDFTTADARYVQQQGDTMSGALVILMTGGDNNTVSFETPHTMSGRILHAQNLLRSSGSLAVEGSVRFNNTGFVYDAGSNTVGIGAEPDGNYGLTLDSGYLGVTGGGIEVLGGYGYFAEDLEVIGTASGRIIHAQNQLRSSGSLVVEANAAIQGVLTLSTALAVANGGTALTSLPTRTIVLSAGGAKPSTKSGSSLKTLTYAVNAVDMYTQAFNATGSVKAAQWTATMPDNYDGGTMTAKFYWTAKASASSLKWFIQCRSFGDGESIDQAWGSSGSVLDTAGAGSGVLISAATSAITCSGTPAGGEVVQFLAYRKPNDGSDNLGVTGSLLSVKLEYLTNSYTD